MKTSVIESIIGYTIRSFTSDFIISEIIDDDKVDFRMGYHSQIHVEVNDNPTYQTININSKWHEDKNGIDHLETDFEIGKKYGLKDINLKMPYPSTLSIWERFLVSRIEIFGFNIDFNLVEQTNHIILIHDSNNRKLLIRPETSALGLYVTLNQTLIEEFFTNTPNSVFIYHSDTYEY